jgi:hypothetical protein
MRALEPAMTVLISHMDSHQLTGKVRLARM